MGRCCFDTPLGWILLDWTERGLKRLRLLGPEPPPRSEPPEPPPFVREAQARLLSFLGGAAPRFGDLPLDLEGLPPFHRRVLELLRDTRPGERLSYGLLARRAGSPGAARAVGQAMAHNPLPLLIPCHRVVAAQGPGGFSLFGSLATKEHLLALEEAAATLPLWSESSPKRS